MFDVFRLKMLNQEAAENRSQEILDGLTLNKGDTILDIGAGGGYYTFRFAEKVGIEGKVYAIDINKVALDFIQKEAIKLGLGNVETVTANVNGFNLPVNNINLMFSRNVYHHLPEPVAYFTNIRKYLKSTGRIAIVDYNRRTFSFTGILGHFTPEKVLIDNMFRSGFYIDKYFDFLPYQSFILFKLGKDK